MKNYFKIFAVFVLVHVISHLCMLLIIFSWTSWGGAKNMNWVQSAIVTFYSFPGLQLQLNQNYPILYLLINGSFWGVVFVMLVYLWRLKKLLVN